MQISETQGKLSNSSTRTKSKKFYNSSIKNNLAIDGFSKEKTNEVSFGQGKFKEVTNTFYAAGAGVLLGVLVVPLLIDKAWKTFLGTMLSPFIDDDDNT